MKRLLKQATTLILMIAMLVTLVSANACAADQGAATQVSGTTDQGAATQVSGTTDQGTAMQVSGTADQGAAMQVPGAGQGPVMPVYDAGQVRQSDPGITANMLTVGTMMTDDIMKGISFLSEDPVLANNSGVKNTQDKRKPVSAKKEMRGMWVATVVNIDYPSKPTTDPEVLKKEALEILDTAGDTGINAVFLQVRPTADAFYKSKIFPWSKFLTGTQGKAPDGGFDPLAFWIEEAHARGIELHAWINPFRITKKTVSESRPTVSSLHSSHPARKNPGWVVQYTDSNLYFNPGIPEVRKLVVDGVMELVNNYDIDGIHFDDYFYPGRDFNDSKTFAAYGKGFKDIGDWRRNNIHLLVSDVYNAIKTSGKDVRFGISPFGIWANKRTTPSEAIPTGLKRITTISPIRGSGSRTASSTISARKYTGTSASRKPTTVSCSPGGRTW